MVRETAKDASTDQGVSPAEVDAVLYELGVGLDSDLISVLQDVQERLGYLPAEVLQCVSDRTRIPLSRVYGVVSFYAQFYTEPQGKHTIRCCRGTACYVRGGEGVIDAIGRRLGVEDGGSTEDMMFSFETVACLGACALAPVVVADGKYYGMATPSSVEEVIDQIADAESNKEETN
ncbi:MAG: NAD(P)H-dependent oxidoreductase subunit E [Phycisphaerae bacterium]|jgi:NADH:ubiquinone oxidoreductase subunit E|nr:NAD(P)H-dependent oxidoreductase subunit E [Phycisphaerae bacterium]